MNSLLDCRGNTVLVYITPAYTCDDEGQATTIATGAGVDAVAMLFSIAGEEITPEIEGIDLRYSFRGFLKSSVGTITDRSIIKWNSEFYKMASIDREQLGSLSCTYYKVIIERIEPQDFLDISMQDESYTGTNCTGSDGAANRVLTLANTSLSTTELVYLDGTLLVNGTNYTINHKTASSTITFLVSVFNTQTIDVEYYLTSAAASSGTNIVREDYTGTNCSGSDGAANRVLTIANTKTSSSESVYLDGLRLTPSTHYNVTHYSSSSLITFLQNVFNTQTVIVVYYV